MLYGRFVPGISRASSVTSQPLDCIILSYGWQPPQPCHESPRSLPGTCHTSGDRGGEKGKKEGTIRPENSSILQPKHFRDCHAGTNLVLSKGCWPCNTIWIPMLYQLPFAVNFVKLYVTAFKKLYTTRWRQFERNFFSHFLLVYFPVVTHLLHINENCRIKDLKKKSWSLQELILHFSPSCFSTLSFLW